MPIQSIATLSCFVQHRTMKEVASIAALIGDPTRANMLLALMQGGARTLSELAQVAAVGLPTASAHAAQLQAGGLIVARK